MFANNTRGWEQFSVLLLHFLKREANRRKLLTSEFIDGTETDFVENAGQFCRQEYDMTPFVVLAPSSGQHQHHSLIRKKNTRRKPLSCISFDCLDLKGEKKINFSQLSIFQCENVNVWRCIRGNLKKKKVLFIFLKCTQICRNCQRYCAVDVQGENMASIL